VVKTIEVSNLGSIAAEITKHSAIQELQVGALSTNVGHLLTSESSNTRPMISLELAHAVEENVQRDTKEVVTNDYIRVGFVEGN
jgi:hypothetical protein